MGDLGAVAWYEEKIEDEEDERARLARIEAEKLAEEARIAELADDSFTQRRRKRQPCSN